MHSRPPRRMRPFVIPEFSMTTAAPIILTVGLLPYFLDASKTKQYLKHFDDFENFEANPHTQELTWDNIKWHWSDGVILSVYEPISLLFKTLVKHFVGGEFNYFVAVDVGK